MENLNAEQIIKALECCSSKIGCKECPLQPKESLAICVTQISKYALALITSQEQKIAELTEEFAVKVVTLIEFDKNIDRLTEENERLSKEVSDLQDELKCEKETNAHLGSQYMSESHLRHQAEEMLAQGMSVVKADTVKKLQKMLIDHFDECGAFTDMETDFIALEIDNVAEEFLRGR
jgi:septal ring factor EnvC (AmiA/AmiB activator)